MGAASAKVPAYACSGCGLLFLSPPPSGVCVGCGALVANRRDLGGSLLSLLCLAVEARTRKLEDVALVSGAIGGFLLGLLGLVLFPTLAAGLLAIPLALAIIFGIATWTLAPLAWARWHPEGELPVVVSPARTRKKLQVLAVVVLLLVLAPLALFVG